MKIRKLLINPNPEEATKEIVSLIDNAIENKKAIASIGNGGYAAESSHFLGELIPLGIPFISLYDTAAITAIANDFSYTEIFSRQIRAYKNQLGLIFILSTSGESHNIELGLIEALNHKIPVVVIVTAHAILLKDLEIQPTLVRETYAHIFSEKYSTLIRYSGDTPNIQEKTLNLIHSIYLYYKNLKSKVGIDSDKVAERT